jgi:hypothetical protein
VGKLFRMMKTTQIDKRCGRDYDDGDNTSETCSSLEIEIFDAYKV